MVATSKEFLLRINQLHGKLIPIWEHGRYKNTTENSGGHWTLPSYDRPVSISIMEGYFLFNLAYATDAENAIEIGTAFGYSTCWIAAGMMLNRAVNNWLGTIDCHMEGGLGEEGHKFAQKIAQEFGLERVIKFFVSRSPEELPCMINRRQLSFAFIDGDHRNNQPAKDYQGIRPFLSTSSIIVWHDVHDSYDTPKAVKLSESDGFNTLELNTSCKMCVSYRDGEMLGHINNAIDASRTFILMPDEES